MKSLAGDLPVSRPRAEQRNRRDVRDARPPGRCERDGSRRIQRQRGEVDRQPPVQKVVVLEIAVAAQAVGTRRVARAGVRVADQRLEEAVVAGLADQPEQMLGDGGLAEVGGVSRTIFQRVGEEYLASHASARILDAPYAGLQFVVVDVQQNGRSPPEHEGKRVESRAALRSAGIGSSARTEISDAQQHHVRFADRRQRASDGAFERRQPKGRRASSLRGGELRIGRLGGGDVDLRLRTGPYPPEMIEISSVVVDDVEAAHAGADLKVQVRIDRERRASDFRTRGSRYEIERTVVVSGPPRGAVKSLRLAKVESMEFALPVASHGRAGGTCRGAGIYRLHMLAVAADGGCFYKKPFSSCGSP